MFNFFNNILMGMSPADFVGFTISAVSACVAFVACYHLYKVSNLLGGLLGSAFRKMAIGILLTMFTVAFLGLAYGPLNIYESMVVAIVGPVAWLTGNIFLLYGFRATIKATRV